MVACIDFFEMSEICRPKFIVCQWRPQNFGRHFLDIQEKRAFLNSSMDQSVESVFYQNVVILLLNLC
jgi:hypothetical protein